MSTISHDLSRVRITETFLSLQGESSLVGLPTFFIRLTGCPLRCSYCDTAYAFSGGTLVELSELVRQAKASGAAWVCVTGGEPLAQVSCLPLLTALCDAGFTVSLETSGAMAISEIDERVIRVVDLKTPDSAEAEKNHWANMEQLKATDQIKFVICSREDYDWSVSMVKKYQLAEIVDEVLFSPSAGLPDSDAEQLASDRLAPDLLAQWILDDKLPVRFQLQLHKIIWGDKTGV